jgi:hypothetical protein
VPNRQIFEAPPRQLPSPHSILMAASVYTSCLRPWTSPQYRTCDTCRARARTSRLQAGARPQLTVSPIYHFIYVLALDNLAYGNLLNHPPFFFEITELPSITFIITELPPIKLGLFLPLQRPIESYAMGLALIGNYILLLVLIFNANLCVDAAHEAMLLIHAPRLARDSSTANRLLVAKYWRTCH